MNFGIFEALASVKFTQDLWSSSLRLSSHKKTPRILTDDLVYVNTTSQIFTRPEKINFGILQL